LPVELDCLGLLTAAEIAAAVGKRFVATYSSADRDPDRVQWVSDLSVGWRLKAIKRSVNSIAYSERSAGSFPCDEFLAFLGDVGVRDV
jgi:hypothetical protein